MKQTTRRRVLLVDDNMTLLRVLNDFLAFEGFDVATAASGEEGLEKLDGFKPDIILLDVSMPGIGGLGFLKRIAASDGRLPYPVLVFTARATTKEFFETIAVDGFIAKPCDKRELVGKIEEILSRQPPPVAEEKVPGQRLVLIAEDEKPEARRLADAFSAAGYDVAVVGSGPEVVERAVVNLPDVILMKQVLPKMNGSSVTSLLQALPRTKAVPVILYDASGVTTNEDEKKFLRPETGIKKYLTTDSPPVLVAAVENLLRNGKRPRATG
jgi:CheY-like chemotaxis protein